MGKAVMLIVDKKMSAGQHRFTIREQDLASGINFHMMRVNEFTDVKKMILIKELSEFQSLSILKNMPGAY